MFCDHVEILAPPQETSCRLPTGQSWCRLWMKEKAVMNTIITATKQSWLHNYSAINWMYAFHVHVCTHSLVERGGGPGISPRNLKN